MNVFFFFSFSEFWIYSKALIRISRSHFIFIALYLSRVGTVYFFFLVIASRSLLNRISLNLSRFDLNEKEPDSYRNASKIISASDRRFCLHIFPNSFSICLKFIFFFFYFYRCCKYLLLDTWLHDTTV